MKVICPTCSASIEVNPASLLGSIKTARKARAARKNGRKHKAIRAIKKKLK